MKSFSIVGLGVFVFGLAACSFYQAKPKMEYYHGRNVPEDYIQVVRATETEIEFNIMVKFNETHLYHIVLDENEPLAEGWFPTRRVRETQSYNVILALKKGCRLEEGKTYRLCIGGQNPEAVQLQSSGYHCLLDYQFVYKPL